MSRPLNGQDEVTMKYVLWILASLAAISCGSTHDYTRTSMGPPPAPGGPDCEVEVLDHFPDERVYRELGFCETKVPGGVLIANEDTKALREFKKCACEAGGNGIVLESGFTSLSEYSRTKNKARATVLVVDPSRPAGF